MVRLYTDNLKISYGEHLIVKDLNYRFPIKKSQRLSVQMAVANLPY